MSSNVEKPFIPTHYEQLLTHYDPEKRVVWHYLNPRPRPCFNPELLDEMHDLQNRVRQHRARSPAAASSIGYMVVASAAPSVFSLGGDLDLFSQLIANRDVAGLRTYAYRCIDCVYNYAAHLNQRGLTTIALVQGKALGGGFEAALSCNLLIAERGAKLGFPEILFNLFPGMGAYSFLVRRIDPILAERMLRNGDQYDAEELHDMGVVDVLAERGEGVHAVYDYIRRHERARNGLDAIRQLREWHNPLTRDELIRIADLWVDGAMEILPRDLRTMGRLTAAQDRLSEASPSSVAEQAGERVVPLRVNNVEEEKAINNEQAAVPMPMGAVSAR